jgi:hypothetical protein
MKILNLRGESLALFPLGDWDNLSELDSINKLVLGIGAPRIAGDLQLRFGS